MTRIHSLVVHALHANVKFGPVLPSSRVPVLPSSRFFASPMPRPPTSSPWPLARGRARARAPRPATHGRGASGASGERL